MEVWGQHHLLAALPPPQVDNPKCPLDVRVGVPRSQSGHGTQEKISGPYRDLNPCLPSCCCKDLSNLRCIVNISVEGEYERQPINTDISATVYGLNDRGFESRQGLGIFLFTNALRPALGITQPPIQRVPGDLSLEVKRLGREADHSPPFSAEIKNAWRYTSTPPKHLHGVVLS
jgi:hypothetical protein